MAQSAGSDYKALVCLFFFGGSNDANNLVVPLDARYQQYSTIRANIALPQASCSVQTPAGTPYGLHPALAGDSSAVGAETAGGAGERRHDRAAHYTRAVSGGQRSGPHEPVLAL